MHATIHDLCETLETITPRGPWKAPLTSGQTQTALQFGIDAAAKAEGFAIDHAFRVPTEDRFKAFVTFSSAFERLAKYAWGRTIAAEPIDQQFVDMVANDKLLQTHYALDIVSSHPAISVMRYVPIIDFSGAPRRDGFEGMVPLRLTKLNKNVYRQVIAFPYVHAHPYNWQDRPNVDYFEAVVPWSPWLPIIGKLMTSFEVQMWRYH